jgi:magnesium-transporting ATPase (P-type)
VSLDEKNLLLAGSFLKNTEWAVGICIYAGPETKMGLNLKQPPSKFSHLDKKLNKYVIMIFAIDFLLCSAMTLLNYFFDVRLPRDELYNGLKLTCTSIHSGVTSCYCSANCSRGKNIYGFGWNLLFVHGSAQLPHPSLPRRYN